MWLLGGSVPSIVILAAGFRADGEECSSIVSWAFGRAGNLDLAILPVRVFFYHGYS
jgi:hypothetical protein